MIAAATQATSSMSLDHLPFGWFDVALLAVLGFGLFRGRKNGMTKEVVPVLQWLSVVFVCGLGYEKVGQILINTAQLGKTLSYVLGYLILGFVVYFLFLLVKKALMPRLTGSNIFGSGEYYLGMLSGMIRYACILIFALALLNAPYYSAADIAKSKAYNARWFGGGETGFSGDFFPTLQTVQEGVFKKSFIGPYIKDDLGAVLIQGAPPDADKQPPKKTPVIHIGN
jgi:uncharacterized membrane protein required for colicin V production